jgi:carboxylate-amine ligase
MPVPFAHSPDLTLGVELELQLLDPQTRDLSPACGRVLEEIGLDHPNVRPELFQSMLEVSTGVCRDVSQVRRELDQTLGLVRVACEKLGVALASSGSHPFARYSDRIVYPAERYQNLIDRNRWVARRLMIFGMHVHVGARDGAHAMALINGLMPYLPHVLALSASSPFWQGRDTGLASSRITIFEALPTAGHPCVFDTWPDFEYAFDAMIASHAIKSVKDIWWDIRPSPGYGTVEIRIADCPPTMSETMAIVALLHSLCAWIDEEYREPANRLRTQPYWAVRENKWRASRWGLDAEAVVDDRGQTVLLREDLSSILSELAPHAERIGARDELQNLTRPLQQGGSYERQRRVYEREGSLVAVVDALIDELKRDQFIG